MNIVEAGKMKRIFVLSGLIFCLFLAGFLVLKMTSSADLVIRIDQGIGLQVTSITLNGVQLPQDGIPIPSGTKRYFEINPKNEQNRLVLSVQRNDTLDIEQRSCQFNKIGRRCLAEVYVNEKSISCFDCVTD